MARERGRFPTGRQTSAKATLPLVLGGWSGAAISSTQLSVADFSLVSRGSLRRILPELSHMPRNQCNSGAIATSGAPCRYNSRP
jgi:hypothetical protein